jgi:hypothetical protein
LTLLRRRADHLSAFFGAAFALVSAALTMICLVLAAFGSAGVADFRAETTELLCKLRTATHQGSGGPTNLRTILIETNAFSHHGDVLFSQTLITAVLTFLRTANASVDTALKLFVAHNRPPFGG